jgi:polyisoprenyl-phosphate glycosyltransferase
VKLLSFSRNFGHQIAISAGIDYSRGDALIVMDGDLQHPPELIPQLVEHWRAGYEVVYTVRQETIDASGFKKLTSSWFYKALRVLSGVRIPEGSADFRLMDRQVAQVFTQFREQDRFIRGLVPWMGFRQIGVPYVAAERHAGRSKYSTLKMVAFGLDGIVSLSYVPLRLSFYTGLGVALMGAIYALYGLGVFIAGRTLPGWTSLLIVSLVLGGIQMMMLGLIGEYIGRIYKEVKNRPLYIIRNTLGLEGRFHRPTG